MEKKKPTNGKNFDTFQVKQLAEIVSFHKKGTGNEIEQSELFKKLHAKFIEGCNVNTFYKNTPKVFRKLTVFYVQMVKALKLAGIQATTETALQWIYNNVVFMALSQCPDVDMSEARSILKQTKS